MKYVVTPDRPLPRAALLLIAATAATALATSAGCQEEVPKIGLCMAVTQIPPGTEITAGDVTVTPFTMEQLQQKQWPLQFATRRVEDIVGRRVRETIEAGEPVLTTKLYPQREPDLHVHTLLRANSPAQAGDVWDGLARMVIMTRTSEEGCLGYDAYQSHEDPTRFLIISQWRRADDYIAHKRGQNYQEIFQQKIAPLVSIEEHPAKVVE